MKRFAEWITDWYEIIFGLIVMSYLFAGLAVVTLKLFAN